MRIIKLEAENLKRLRAVEITPDGDVVVIAGRNAQGKTSVLDAIALALGGGAAAKGTSKPIRDGEDTATVVLDLDDLTVTRTWTGDKTSLTVASKEGARYSSPQAMLDGLVGRLSFDPLAFANQDQRAQLKTLLDLVDLPFDVAELDAQRQAAYDERTVVNRQIKDAKAQLAGLGKPSANVPLEEVSASEALAALQAGQQLHREAAERSSLIAATSERIVQLRADLARAEQDLEAFQLAALGAPELPDLDRLQADLDNVETVNRSVRDARAYREKAEALKAREADAAALTARIQECDATKAAGVAAAKMPIDGLGFDETGVLYQGVPFAQASGAERLRVSLAMAMAMNPQIRVIRITDGSLLDSDNMRLIAEQAAEHDFQVWVERVDESGAIGVVIEDGQVRA